MEYDNVNRPKHYVEGFATRPIECIDITRHMPFTLGCAFKYVWRAGKKGGKEQALEDLAKARWYLRQPVDFSYSIVFVHTIFGMLVDDGSHRYQALKWIVNGGLGIAIGEIAAMEKEFKTERAK